jgi:hypothetical protein
VNNEDILKYQTSWEEFRKACEIKAKNRCHLNTSAWKRLKEFHIEQYLRDMENPFGFLFVLKFYHNSFFRSIPKSACLYSFYLKKRQEDYGIIVDKSGMFSNYKDSLYGRKDSSDN